MMRRWTLWIGVTVLFVGSAPALSAEVSVVDLVEQGARYGGTEVTVVGELIGDYGSRSDGFTWTQLNGDSYVAAPIVDGGELTGSNVGIGIRLPSRIVESLAPPGGYSIVGPIVEITGMWKYHDPQRLGETYLEVTRLVVVERGRELSEQPNWLMYMVGAAMLVAARSMLWSYRKRQATLG